MRAVDIPLPTTFVPVKAQSPYVSGASVALDSSTSHENTTNSSFPTPTE